MNRKQWIIIIGISFLALIAGVLSSQWISNAKRVDEAGVKAFFANSWQTPDGHSANTQEWQGKLLVVNFWASWCPPCVKEMPTLNLLQKEYQQQNVIFVGIGIDSPTNIREFLQKTPISYPIVIGGLEGSNISKLLGNSQGALPYTVVINPQGKVISSKLGEISEDELRNAIKSAL
ncbi:Thiol-disulfide isomerase or thioredoxin [Polynucleobacter meluiroseus]|uniref:Thiol-disulfide isomerase or thioredoxin n=1 Tax=Polynucleobacter meluiroseus TaxID=1938814 RepID=A0A240E1B0_9BURK|nr:TlpA disulfide reductase family protein [Polynucleobacter meluiroseus]SNX29007.1 Thiol-disulfide isomerase or thioredoxin [Polynucleobacter meluiroseus]